MRERKKARTRAALAEAALEAFSKHGFDETTIAEIAAAVDVSPRTFFRYFESKEAAVFANNAGRLAAFRAQLAVVDVQEPPFTALGRALRVTAGQWHRSSRELVARHAVVESSPALIAHELELDREWEAAMADELLRRCHAGAAASHWARACAGATMGAVRVALRQWFESGGKADLVRLGDSVLCFVERGFGAGPPKGVAS